MVELWIPITVAGAFLQCTRTALQKGLASTLGTSAANFVRYAYGAPIAALALLILAQGYGMAVPMPGLAFWLYCLLAGLTQIWATSLLILAFTLRNFAVGTTFSKTETAQTALLATFVLGEPLSLGAWGAILLCLVGILVLAQRRIAGGWRGFIEGFSDRAALMGIGSGGLFGVTAVAIRGASLSLGAAPPLSRAALTLSVVTALQTALMGLYLAWREPTELRRAFTTWRQSSWVGIMSVGGSACWFLAFTLENAAYVRALGQVELVFTFLAARLFFHERSTAIEILGVLLVVASVIILVLLH
ncbi:MAG: EamA family transporter [Proteobacteria bacterium]|nr:EamA family transporter [Pseudomonadota bacterium]MBI3499783.1 EamA family transporter [Pseudomonadota bacterium]